MVVSVIIIIVIVVVVRSLVLVFWSGDVNLALVVRRIA
jgi:hypothetical protein